MTNSSNANQGFISANVANPYGIVVNAYGHLTPSGSMLSFRGSVGQGVLNPSLYFRFVKSKLTKVEKAFLKMRIARLQQIIRDTEAIGQTGLQEKSMQALVTAVRELEAVAIGCDRVVTRDIIDRYHLVRRDDDRNPAYFTPWHQFPRSPPPEVQKRLAEVQAKKVFDSYWVLYLDYTKDGKPLKTNREKIREKDPILFGAFNHAPERFYFIVDWVDDACDLTFDEFVGQLKLSPDQLDVPEMSAEYFQEVKKSVESRLQRLAASRPDNFQRLMAEEDKFVAVVKKPWWKFWARS